MTFTKKDIKTAIEVIKKMQDLGYTINDWDDEGNIEIKYDNGFDNKIHKNWHSEDMACSLLVQEMNSYK